MRRKRKRIEVVERKLQRGLRKGLLYGQAWTDGIIEIDPRLNRRPQTYLDTVIHEVLHIVFPDMSETKVRQSARELAGVLWRVGYRRTI